MKTKEFIKMLKEADPSGEAYVRLPDGGAPYYAEHKEGYWDGAYQYLEKIDGHKPTLITSTRGSKVDITSLHIDDIVWEEDGNIERIKNRLRFDMTFYPDVNNNKINTYMKYVEEEAEWVHKKHIDSVEDWKNRVLEKWFNEEDIITTEIRQPLDKKIGWFNQMTAHHLFKSKQHLCQGECMAIIESGEFYPEKNKKYYIWRYNPEKGKKWSLK